MAQQIEKINGLENAQVPQPQSAVTVEQQRTLGQPIVFAATGTSSIATTIPYSMAVSEVQVVVENNNATAGSVSFTYIAIGNLTLLNNVAFPIGLVSGDTKAFRVRFDFPNYAAVASGNGVTATFTVTGGTYNVTMFIIGYAL